MELSRVADIDNAKVNITEKAQKINEVKVDTKVIQDEEYKKALGKPQEVDANEVILDNIKFGYNSDTKDFFVKITRGEAEYKYPTEDMMKVKAFLMQELQKNSN